MAVEGGISAMKQHVAKQQNMDTHTNNTSSKHVLAKPQQDHSEDHQQSQQLPQRHSNIGTSTAYAEDTDVMVSRPPHPQPQPKLTPTLQEVPYLHPRHTHQSPQYTAAQLAPALDTLTNPHASSPPPNPFTLPPSSLQPWHAARTNLSNPTYFYTTLLKNYHLPGKPSEVRPEPEERFEVRVQESVVEIEQGLADLRAELLACLRSGDQGRLEALRGRVGGAVDGGGLR